jgi:hypothetical protein
MLTERQINYVKFWIDYDIDYCKNELQGYKEVLKNEKDKDSRRQIKDDIAFNEEKIEFLKEFKSEL